MRRPLADFSSAPVSLPLSGGWWCTPSEAVRTACRPSYAGGSTPGGTAIRWHGKRAVVFTVTGIVQGVALYTRKTYISRPHWSAGRWTVADSQGLGH